MATYVFNTFGDVVDEAYDILSVDGDSNTFPGMSRANFNKFANRFNKEFVDSVKVRTQEATTSFTTVADTTIATAATSGAVSLSITLATGWPASGLTIVDGIPMTFTLSGTTLTVAAIPRDIDAGAVVQLAYAIPSDYWRTRGLFVGDLPYGYQRRGDTVTPSTQHFALYGDYIVLPVAASGDENVTHHYYKKPTATLTSTDTMDIMEMWDSYIIYKLVAHGFSVLEDENREAVFNAKAEAQKKKARGHFAKLDGSLGNAFIPGF